MYSSFIKQGTIFSAFRKFPLVTPEYRGMCLQQEKIVVV